MSGGKQTQPGGLDEQDGAGGSPAAVPVDQGTGAGADKQERGGEDGKAEALPGAPGGAARVLSVFDLLMRWFAEPGYHGCTVVNTVTDMRADPGVASIARRHLARYRDLLASRAAEAGLEDPDALARQLLLLIEGASVITAIDGKPDAGADARRAAETLIRQSSR